MSDHTHGWGLGLECLLKQRVAVEWRECEEGETRYFGCLSTEQSDCKDCVGKLSLEIHHDNAIRAALVKFHLPVKTRASSSKTPKDMYLVLPAARLSMNTLADAAAPDDAHQHLPALNPGESYTRVRLEIEGSPAPYTVMPAITRRRGSVGKVVRGTPRRMLMYLKSLSKATSWTLHIVGDRPMQERFEQVSQWLQAQSVCDPPINLATIYPDGVRAVVDNWADYPYSPTEEGSLLRNLPRDPPPYSPVHERPLERARESPEFHLYWKTSPPSLMDHVIDTTERLQGQSFATEKRKTMDAPHTSEDTHARKKLKQDNCGLPSLIATPDAEAENNLDNATDPAKTEFAEPDVEDGAAVAEDTADGLEGTTVPDSPRTKYDGSGSLPQTPATLQFDTSCLAESAEWILYLDLIRFILYATERDIAAHNTYKRQLLDMGSHARKRDVRAFHDTKLLCSLDMNKRASCDDLGPRLAPEATDDQIFVLAGWVDREISREAYRYLDGQFDCVAGLFSNPKESAELLRREYQVRRAECLAAAFFAFGNLRRSRGLQALDVCCPPVLCFSCVDMVMGECFPSI